MNKIWLFLVMAHQCLNLNGQSVTEFPQAIELLEENQLSFVEQERQFEVQRSKEFINGRRGNSTSNGKKPLLSPLQALKPSVAEELVNRTVEPLEWILTYTGTENTYALLIIFIILPYFIAFFVFNYIVRPLKPELVFKRNEEFPIIPLVYLQETKAEQRIMRPKRNSIEWVATRYLIMASDNVANLKMLDYIDDKETVRDRKHHGWFILRLLAKFNALYTRNRVDVERKYSPVRQTLKKTTQWKSKVNADSAYLTEDNTYKNDPLSKISELLLLKRIRNYEKQLETYEGPTEPVTRWKDDYARQETNAKKDRSDRSYKDDDESSRDDVNNYSQHDKEVQGRGIRKPDLRRRRTSLEIIHEGYRQAIKNPLNAYNPEDLRLFQSEESSKEYLDEGSLVEDNQNTSWKEAPGLDNTKERIMHWEIPPIQQKHHEWDKEKFRHRHFLNRSQKVDYRRHSLRKREEEAAKKLRGRRNLMQEERRRSHDVPTMPQQYNHPHEHKHHEHEHHEHHEHEHHEHHEHEHHEHKHAYHLRPGH